MARPQVTPPDPIDLTDQRIQIGDTTAFVSKLNTTQDEFERFSEETDAYANQLNALGDYLEQRADSADADAAATAADRQAVDDDKTSVASDRQAVETTTSQVASDASAAAESADTASAAAQTSQQLRDQTQTLRDQAEAIAFDDDIESSVMQLINDSWNYWRENERDDDVAVQNGRYKFARLTSGDDAGDAWAHGFYGVFSSAEARQMTGLPVATSGVLMSINPTESKHGCHQIYFSNNDREAYYRSLFNDNSDWRKVFSEDFQDIESGILNQAGVYYPSDPPINIDDKSIGGAVGLWDVGHSGGSAPWFLPNNFGFFETRRLYNSKIDRFFQTVKSYNRRNKPPEFGYRIKGDEGWTPWARSLNSLNVLSPVEQPDADHNVKGGVIERGENSAGEYIKFADGTMICTGKMIKDFSDINIRERIHYPVSFLNSSVFVGLSLKATNQSVQFRRTAFYTCVTDVQKDNFIIFNLVSSTETNSSYHHIFAIGRWY